MGVVFPKKNQLKEKRHRKKGGTLKSGGLQSAQPGSTRGDERRRRSGPGGQREPSGGRAPPPAAPGARVRAGGRLARGLEGVSGAGIGGSRPLGGLGRGGGGAGRREWPEPAGPGRFVC